MTYRRTAMSKGLLTATITLLALVMLVLACGPAAPGGQSGQGSGAAATATPTPTLAPTPTIALSDGDTDTDGDGYLNYEAIDVDTGKKVQLELSPTALHISGSYRAGDRRVYLHRQFKNHPMVRIKSTGQRFFRRVGDSACEVTEVKVLKMFNGAASELDWYKEDTILVQSRAFTTWDPEPGQERMLLGYTYGLDKGLGIENGKEYLLFITPKRERAGRSVIDPDCPFWGDQTFYRAGLGYGFYLWEIDGAVLKETHHYGSPLDFSTTKRELFADAGGISGASEDGEIHIDETLRLSLPEALKLAKLDTEPAP